MEVKEILTNTLKEFGPIAFEQYKGSNETYLTYNYEDERGESYSDDKAEYTRHYIQVHYFAPYSEYKETVKIRLRKKLLEIASVTKAFTTRELDTNLVHIVFSIEIDVMEE